MHQAPRPGVGEGRGSIVESFRYIPFRFLVGAQGTVDTGGGVGTARRSSCQDTTTMAPERLFDGSVDTG